MIQICTQVKSKGSLRTQKYFESLKSEKKVRKKLRMNERKKESE